MAHLALVLGRQQMAKSTQLLHLALDAGRAFQQQPGHGIDVGRALIFHAFGQQAQTIGQGGEIAFDVQQRKEKYFGPRGLLKVGIGK